MSLIHLMGLKKVLKNSTTVNLDNGAKTATTYSTIPPSQSLTLVIGS